MRYGFIFLSLIHSLCFSRGLPVPIPSRTRLLVFLMGYHPPCQHGGGGGYHPCLTQKFELAYRR